MTSTCWDTRTTDSIIKSGQKDTEASLLRSFQLEETEQLITMLVKLAMLLSKCSHVSKLLRTESETCLQWCLKPGLHIVGRIAEHACDDASERILKLPTYRLNIFLVKYQNLWPLQRFIDQTITVQLKIHVRACDPYDLYGDQA